jgi:hypothetical protein
MPAQKDEGELLKTFFRHQGADLKVARRAYENRRKLGSSLQQAQDEATGDNAKQNQAYNVAAHGHCPFLKSGAL